MSTLILKLSQFFGGISMAFEGTLGQDNQEIVEMRNEVLYDPIPDASTDRENLKGDARKISGDIGRAYEEYKTEKHLVG